MDDVKSHRRLPVGAEVIPAHGTHFRVWAPRRHQVEVVIEGGPGGREGEPYILPLSAESRGYYAGLVPEAGVGTLYRYRLDGEELFPDPASRFQPEGPHGPSRVVDPSGFSWTDHAWRGIGPKGQVIYEMHIGTFTLEGTWRAAMRELPELASLGITVLEVMPVAEFPGRFGWGYDGVSLFAPTRLYGEPDDLRAFVDRAHALGLAVILDIVHNHLGPDGNYLGQFSSDYFTDRYVSEWGEAINFDGPSSRPVREFFTANAGYWIDEFHVDGYRLDATQAIYDYSEAHILSDHSRRAREVAKDRKILMVAENEAQESRLVRPLGQGGYGLDALWNDDFHHSARVALTGHNEAYYRDFHGTPQELISAIKWSYLFQGQRYGVTRRRRGSPAFDLKPWNYVNFIENHDQVANAMRGQRLHQLTSPGRYRAITALLLLAPGTPMLFQGQEFGSTAPFVYFADHGGELAKVVAKGRLEALHRFPSQATREMQGSYRDPADPETFRRCKLDLSERGRHHAIYALHQDLLRLRRTDPVFSVQRFRGVDGAVLGYHAFVLRFFWKHQQDRLLIVNLGRDLHLDPAPEPLLASHEGNFWTTLWSSEDPQYGGNGAPELETEAGWWIPGEAAVVLAPVRKADRP